MPEDEKSSSDLTEKLDAIRTSFPGRMGIAVKHVRTGEMVELGAGESFPTASSIKVPILYEVFRQAEKGRFSLGDRIALRDEVKVAGSGILCDVIPGLEATIHDFCMLMIIVSDNTATNMMIDLVGGPEVVTTTMRGLDLDTIHLKNRIDFDQFEDDELDFAEASPADLMSLAELIGTGRAISADASAGMLRIMKRQHNLVAFPRFFNYNRYGPELGEPQPIWVANKTGSMPGIRADMGLVGLPGDDLIAFCVMTDGGPDRGFTPSNRNEIAIGEVGKAVLEAWWPDERGMPAPVIQMA